MTVLTDIGALYTVPLDGGQDAVGRIDGAALAVRDGRVAWVGRAADLPAAYAAAPRRSAEGRTVVPGLVDCHTHLAFGGERTGEFVARLRGQAYLDIARKGGGIRSTMAATRAASDAELRAQTADALAAMLRRGVTTVEAKSGYGLSARHELRQLRALRDAGAASPQRVVATCLALHTVPPEHAEDRGAYLEHVVRDVYPAVAAERLARFADAFVEDAAFSPDEARRALAAAREHGLVPKLHADQLTDTGGAALAAALGAASADHLEQISDAGIDALAASDTVAVSLPLATLVLGVEPLPARRLIERGVPVAVATDYNPGSAPVHDLPLALWAACVRQRMTPAEVLKGATAFGAKALRLGDVGSLLPGFAADWVELDAPSVDAWLYSFRHDAVRATAIAGEVVAGA